MYIAMRVLNHDCVFTKPDVGHTLNLGNHILNGLFRIHYGGECDLILGRL